MSLLAGDYPAAIEFLTRSADSFGAAGDRPRQGMSLLRLAEALAGAGRLDAARERREAADALLRGVDLPAADLVRARLAAAVGDGSGH